MTIKSVGQILLIGMILGSSWLMMQAIHELGHVVGAWLTGGTVERVVLHPLAISRTDLAENPQPLIVAWCGPITGAALPLIAWTLASVVRLPGKRSLQFFAGFCLVANGFYIGLGSFNRIGDCGDMLRHGAAIWHLWLFGTAAASAGLFLWHRLGSPSEWTRLGAGDL
jgi:hypothetical protein